MAKASSSFTPTRPEGRRRRRGWVLAVLLLLGALAGLSRYGQTLLAPQPERFASAVVTRGPALAAAEATPLAQAYRRDFHTQAHPASCGPASLRNVLASLGRPVASERALFDGAPLAWRRMRVMGMTLDELAALAQARGVGRVQVHRDLSAPDFRALLRSLARPGRRLIVNFDRAPLHGVSLGHFSPIGGFDPAGDRVLLLDVTPGYGPQLVPTHVLAAAMRSVALSPSLASIGPVGSNRETAISSPVRQPPCMCAIRMVPPACFRQTCCAGARLLQVEAV